MKTVAKYLAYILKRLFLLILMTIILIAGIFYRFPGVEIFGVKIINHFYIEIEAIPVWLYYVIYAIIIFIISIILIFFMILILNSYKDQNDKIDARFVDSMIKKIFRYLYPIEEFTDKQKKYELREIRKDLFNNHSKELFINTLRQIHAQTKGAINDKTTFLMNEINYKYFIYAYLHSPRIGDRLFALKVIGDFQLEGYEKFILKLTDKKNEILHSEAIVTLLKLKIYDSLLFLLNINMKLSVWDINMIIKSVLELKIENIDYATLINSEIPEISTLGIMLARIKNRKEFKDDIKLKINDKNILVTEEACIAFAYFSDNEEDYDLLIEKFKSATEKSQFAIIQKIAKIDDSAKSSDFLNYVVENQHFTQKIEAIKLLLDIDINSVTKFRQSDNLSIKQSVYQVLDINV